MLSFIVNTKSQNQQPDYQILTNPESHENFNMDLRFGWGSVRSDDKLDSCINFLNFIRRKGKRNLILFK